MLIVVRKFHVISMDFGLELNVMTRLLFGLQKLLSAGGWVIVIGIPIGLGFASARMTPGRQRALRAWTSLLFAALVLLAVGGLAAPLTQLIGGMNGSGSVR